MPAQRKAHRSHHLRASKLVSLTRVGRCAVKGMSILAGANPARLRDASHPLPRASLCGLFPGDGSWTDATAIASHMGVELVVEAGISRSLPGGAGVSEHSHGALPRHAGVQTGRKPIMKSPSEQGMTVVFSQRIILVVPMIENIPKIPSLRHGQKARRRHGTQPSPSINACQQ